jgi:membrane fusion protein, multidrug efflux system
MKTLLQIIAAVVVIGAAAGGFVYFTGHSAAASSAASAASAPAKPPTPVSVTTLSEQDVRLWSEFSGRMHAVDYAEIRPEVTGRITEVRFQDGQYVKEGDILFAIDPRPYAAVVEHDQAALESARSQLVRANQDEDRGKSLIASHAIAQGDLDTYDNTARTAQANIDAADAQLKQAQVDLEHCYVTAPIGGRVSRAEITLGNVVQSGVNAPLLTSVVSRDGIYADFEVDEQTYLDTIRGGAVGNEQEQKIPVALVAGNDTGHVYHGFMQSFDNRIDPSSGTIRARAKFANEDGSLVPGMFVSVRLASSQDRPVLLVPDRAVGFDQSKTFVYVVDADNKVNYRQVSLGTTIDGHRVVESGLNAGERVIVDGTQYVRPNDIVAAKEVADTAVNTDQQVANK